MAISGPAFMVAHIILRMHGYYLGIHDEDEVFEILHKISDAKVDCDIWLIEQWLRRKTMTGGMPLSEAYPITAELAVQAVYDDILCPLDIVGGFLGAKPSDHPGPQLRHYSELCT
jgi:hypothetical protein